MKKIKIIAEIGCNHNGSMDLAKKMVDEAAKCGVDGVKFQTFIAEELISKYAPKAEYQVKTTGSDENQLEMTKKLELSFDEYIELKKYAENKNLEVFSTAFDLISIEFLHKLGQTTWKIPSGEITNLPYLEKIRDLQCENKQIILSTGMSSIEEIRQAIDILNKNGKLDIVVLHCNTEYPTKDEDVNISAIYDLHKNFKDYEIGFSDHSVGNVAATMAVAFDICFIEKHFTLDKNMEGPDHKASATPEELKELVDNVRRAEIIKGISKKIITKSEKKNINIARKSIVVKKSLKKGEEFTVENITCKRPGSGVSPMYWYDVLGKKSKRDYEADELINEDELI